MSIPEQKRIEYLDAAKGIGIIMVCIGHACTNQAVIMDCKYADIIRFVTLFHMALFFFVNGILYNEKYSRMPIMGIKKKFKSYYIPFVIYNLIFWIFHNMFGRLYLISGKLDPKDYAYTSAKSYLVSFLKSVVGYRQRFAGAMWFLEALIIISIIFILLDYMITRCLNKRRVLLLSISIGLITLLNHMLNIYSIPFVPGSISQMIYWGLNGLVFFYLGYLYRYYHVNEKINKYKSIIIPILLILLIVTVIIMRPDVISSITQPSLAVFQYGINAIIGFHVTDQLSLLQYLIYTLIGIAGITMVLLLSQYRIVMNNKVLKILGRYSLHIMCLQFFAFKAVSLLIVIVYHLPVNRIAEYPVMKDINGLWWIAYTFAGCCLPVLLVKICTKVKEGILFIYKKISEKISVEKKSCV